MLVAMFVICVLGKLAIVSFMSSPFSPPQLTVANPITVHYTEGHFGHFEHAWDLDFWKWPIFLKINFARVNLYAITLGICKMSILFFYARIFQFGGNYIRWVLWATQIFNGLLSLSYLVTSFFVARPLNCVWEINELLSECVYSDVWDGSGAYAAVNGALDVWMVLIPAFVVWRLQMSTSRKLSIIAIFAAGFM